MKRLLLDVGNSRVKWALAGAIDDMRPLDHDGDPAAAFARILDACGPVDALAYVDVTGRLAAGLPAGLDARRLEATVAACGVTNAYPEPGRLGADRWAALIGAHAAVEGAACIIDAGTALTADVLGADGRHIGGWIAPGLRLGAVALTRDTRLSAGPGRVDGTALATDTASAIAAGTRAAALGFIERAWVEAERALGGRPALVITGGDARTLGTGFGGAVVIENLVLRGLARWMEAD